MFTKGRGQEVEDNAKQTEDLRRLWGNRSPWDELPRYLHEPGQEEYERDEVEVGSPAGEAVDGSVHEEHPALLRRGLIDGEYAGACGDTEVQTDSQWALQMRKQVSEKTIDIHPGSFSQ